MCDPLGRYLLLPLWFAEDFEEESFASSLEIFFFLVLDSLGKNLLLLHLGYFGEESFASSMGMMLDMLELLRKSLLLPLWG